MAQILLMWQDLFCFTMQHAIYDETRLQGFRPRSFHHTDFSSSTYVQRMLFNCLLEAGLMK